ncbi:hypothetical protein IJ556_00095 [bacterium]|nr:hypothetical protein [bacterium]
MKKDYISIEKQIDSCKCEIVSTVEWIQILKQKINISEDTISHIKRYIADVQAEIDALNAEIEQFVDIVESLQMMPDVSAAEYKAYRYRFIYGWTIPKICNLLHKSPETIHRYLRKCEEMLGMVSE